MRPGNSDVSSDILPPLVYCYYDDFFRVHLFLAVLFFVFFALSLPSSELGEVPLDVTTKEVGTSGLDR